jgi:hypothetical protein
MHSVRPCGGPRSAGPCGRGALKGRSRLSVGAAGWTRQSRTNHQPCPLRWADATQPVAQSRNARATSHSAVSLPLTVCLVHVCTSVERISDGSNSREARLRSDSQPWQSTMSDIKTTAPVLSVETDGRSRLVCPPCRRHCLTTPPSFGEGPLYP